MLSYSQALGQILKRVQPLPEQRTHLDQALDLFLARDVVARRPAPEFDQSDVDGFGVRVADVSRATKTEPAGLPIAATIQAGASSPPPLKRHTAVKLFTGAPVPSGVEAVVMKEYCAPQPDRVLISYIPFAGENIRHRGDEFTSGAKILARGLRITPPVVGMLAALGYGELWTYRKPAVSLITTGNELAAPGARLRSGQIYDANSVAVSAALTRLGLDRIKRCRVKDDALLLKRVLQDCLNTSEVVITVGGVSVGDYDFVKEAAGQVGVETVFWRVAMKPGMPNFFGVFPAPSARGGRGKRQASERAKLLFGLPGNPVSALVSFYQLVRPALLGLMGQPKPQRFLCPAQLSQELRKKAGRLEWVRGKLTLNNGVLYAGLSGGQKSHMLSGLATADCLIELPASTVVFKKGAAVWVEPLAW